MAIAFISGHLDLTQAEFDEHYKARIDAAIAVGDDFVVGDARGADSLAQYYLHTKRISHWFSVTVYHAYATPRTALKHFFQRGGYPSQAQKDKGMTENSDYDIAWVRPGREKSGTADNLKRREKFNKQKGDGNG